MSEEKNIRPQTGGLLITANAISFTSVSGLYCSCVIVRLTGIVSAILLMSLAPMRAVTGALLKRIILI